MPTPQVEVRCLAQEVVNETVANAMKIGEELTPAQKTKIGEELQSNVQSELVKIYWLLKYLGMRVKALEPKEAACEAKEVQETQ